MKSDIITITCARGSHASRITTACNELKIQFNPTPFNLRSKNCQSDTTYNDNYGANDHEDDVEKVKNIGGQKIKIKPPRHPNMIKYIIILNLSSLRLLLGVNTERWCMPDNRRIP